MSASSTVLVSAPRALNPDPLARPGESTAFADGYEFFVDEDGGRFVAHEAYADSAGILAHLKHLTASGIPQRMTDVVTFDAAFVLGDATAEVREALGPLCFQFLEMAERARG